ncbi:hypothetical protein [Streptomyces sp. bgisy126]|uniref:hypothetical protein n=1 Tax=unclassified Streptomyces TaxID=2593676 RepID=UPI003EC00AA8
MATNRFELHEGMVGVLLADGSEPKPVLFDLGSGATFHESSDWWLYDGTFRRPTAVSIRGRCACGWRGTKTSPGGMLLSWGLSSDRRGRPVTAC